EMLVTLRGRAGSTPAVGTVSLAWWKRKDTAASNSAAERHASSTLAASTNKREAPHVQARSAADPLVLPDKSPALAGRGEDEIRRHRRRRRRVRRRGALAVGDLEAAGGRAPAADGAVEQARREVLARERLPARRLPLPVLRQEVPRARALLRPRGAARCRWPHGLGEHRDGVQA